ncbi:MAG: SLC13 family permease [Xanthomonadales bacterium]|nr:SLC13 family permease [Xanthomonadales bacterium]
MSLPHIQILLVLAVTMGLFLWGRFRHDLVALASLLACVLLGLVPADGAFLGFGHPAVVTVACVLVLSRGLLDSGAVDSLAHHLLPSSLGPVSGLVALTALGALLSAFMNNVGAMALLLPIALQMSDRFDLPPARMLMPLAFGTILGGMTTLIGTPPNLIVSGFRESAGRGAFDMFDFSPIGLSVAAAGLLFVWLVGWRLVPARGSGRAGAFDTEAYLAEAHVGENSKSIGQTLGQSESLLEKQGAQIVGLVRDGTRLYAPNPRRRVRPHDILIIEADPEDLASILSILDLSIEEPATQEDRAKSKEVSETDPDAPVGPVMVKELVVMPGSKLIGRSSGGVQMDRRRGLILLALSRQGQRSIRRLRTTRFKAGDLLLVQGQPEALGAFAGEYSLVPLAERDIRLPDGRKAAGAFGILAAAIALTASGLLSAPVAFALGVLGMAVGGILAPRNLYQAVDWPVIVLLAALIPVAGAMASTGTADFLAQNLLDRVAAGSPVIALGLILVVTMTLSDFMNNAATAAVMCPIAISTAAQLDANPDAFLMAVAIGASCAFLTPIGHQNNTLILGPGGLRFGDYWRLGLPMEILVVAVSLPLLLLIWPL